MTCHCFNFCKKESIAHFGYRCFVYFLSLENLQGGLVFRNAGVMITEMKMGRSVWEPSGCKEERHFLTPLSINRSLERAS